jgi:arsenite-transporting ATPase
LTNEIRGTDKLIPFSNMLVDDSFVQKKMAEGIDDTKADA